MWQFPAHTDRRGPSRRTVTTGVGLGAVVVTAAAVAHAAAAGASTLPAGEARQALAQASGNATTGA